MRSVPASLSSLVNTVSLGRIKLGWWSSRYRSDARPIIIGGAPRSGTTLLRAMLTAHPDIWIGPENGVFQEGGQNLPGMEACLSIPVRRLDVLRHRASCLGEFVDLTMREVLERERKPVWGLKSPAVVHELSVVWRFFPGARFVHTLRDGRDVVCSLRTHPKFRTVEGQRVATGIVNPWPQCVETWVSATNAGLRWRESQQYFELKYEDLVESPSRIMRALIDFLGLRFDDAMLRHHERPINEGIDSPHPGASKPVYRSAVTRWQTDLTPEARAAFTPDANRLLQDLGYTSSRDWWTRDT